MLWILFIFITLYQESLTLIFRKLDMCGKNWLTKTNIFTCVIIKSTVGPDRYTLSNAQYLIYIWIIWAQWLLFRAFKTFEQRGTKIWPKGLFPVQIEWFFLASDCIQFCASLNVVIQIDNKKHFNSPYVSNYFVSGQSLT